MLLTRSSGGLVALIVLILDRTDPFWVRVLVFFEMAMATASAILAIYCSYSYSVIDFGTLAISDLYCGFMTLRPGCFDRELPNDDQTS